MEDAIKKRAQIRELKFQAEQLRNTEKKLKLEATMICLAAKAIEEMAAGMEKE